MCSLPSWDNHESGVPWKMFLGEKLSLFLWHTFKTRKPVMFVPFSVSSHRSVVFLVKEMSTSLISISEGRTSSYLFWLVLVLLWPSLAGEIWISSMAGCRSCSSMKIQGEVSSLRDSLYPRMLRGDWWSQLLLAVDVLSVPLFLFYFWGRQVGNWSETSKDVNVILVLFLQQSFVWPGPEIKC